MKLKDLEIIPPWEWPEDTGSFLLNILEDPSESEEDRILATEFAGNYVVMDNAIAIKLLEMIQSEGEPETLRARAAIALGPALEAGDIDGFEDEEDELISEEVHSQLLKGLEQLFKDENIPKEVRRMIFEASVRAPQDWHPEAIRKIYASKDSDWQLTAVFGMAHVRGFEDEIISELGNESLEIQYQAVRGAGNWSIENAWRYLKLYAMDPDMDIDIRAAAIEGLSGIRPDDSMAIFLELLDSDEETICATAEEAMAMAEMEIMLNGDGEVEESEFF